MSGLLAVKLRRDLRGTWPRVLLMVVAIAIGLTVFGAALATRLTMAREFARAYASTEPASATFLLDRAVDEEEMAAVVAAARTLPGVLEATGRAVLVGDVRGGDGRERDLPVQLFVAAPDDPLTMAGFETRDGTWPPEEDEVLLSGDSLDLLDLAVGEEVVVGTPAAEARLRVAGTVYDPSLSPAIQEQRGHGYLTTAALPREAVLDQLKIQIAGPLTPSTPSRDRDAIVAVSGDVADWLQREQGLGVTEIQVPEPYAHPHQAQSDTLLLALVVAGAATLVLSAVLVATMLNGLFAQQIPQIGILKAIGARSGRIARQYLAALVLIAAAATLLALPLAVLVARAGTAWVLSLLGIEAFDPQPSWEALAAVTAAGLVLPPVTALVPLVRTSRTTVRAAMDHRGVGSRNALASARVLAPLTRLRGLDRGLLMALRNSSRRPARLLLSIGLLAAAGAVFVAGMSTRVGVEALQDQARAQRRWDVDVRLAAPADLDAVSAALAEVPGITLVDGVTVEQGAIARTGEVPITRTYPDQGHGGVNVVALQADTATLAPPVLLEGRWLEPGERGAIVLNQVARAQVGLDVGAGDTLRLTLAERSANWTIVGIIQEPGGGAGMHVTSEGFAQATGRPQQVSQLRIATLDHDEPTRDAVADAAAEALTAAGIPVRAADSVAVRDASLAEHLSPIVLIMLAIAVAIAAVGGIGLASTMSAGVLDRTREFGVLHAIGAPPASVRRIVTAEGVLLALASCVIAVLPALALTALIGSGLGNLFMAAPVPFRISTFAAGIWVVLVLFGAMLASEAAATRAARLTVREALVAL